MCVSLVAIVLLAQGSVSLPWVYPGDFGGRLRISDLVVAGTIAQTSIVGVRTVGGVQVTGHTATVQIDRVFQGNAKRERLSFSWFTPHSLGGMGFAYSGPPVAQFQVGTRYLIFLKRVPSGWEVAMPVYGIEMELEAAAPRGSIPNLSHAPEEQKYRELAEELENAALALPTPPSGSTGKAVLYFSPIFDILGACAQPFYRRFLSSPSPPLRDEASRWLEIIRSRHLECKGAPLRLVP
jgi:hypothetical protein